MTLAYNGLCGGRACPHAVGTVSGTLNATYNYGANGNLLSGNGTSLACTMGTRRD
jgi:hypothetical protein